MTCRPDGFYDFFSFLRMLVCSKAAARRFLYKQPKKTKHSVKHHPTQRYSDPAKLTCVCETSRNADAYVGSEGCGRHHVDRLGNLLGRFGGRFELQIASARPDQRREGVGAAPEWRQPADVGHLVNQSQRGLVLRSAQTRTMVGGYPSY